MKSIALSVSTVLLLTACATGPRPVQVMEACPRVPTLELQDVPERAYLAEMQNFLQGWLPMPSELSLRLEPASPTRLRLNANSTAD